MDNPQNSGRTGQNDYGQNDYGQSYSSTSTSTSTDTLADKAAQWLNKGSMGEMLGKLSTTQKVLGGALLVLGAGALLRGSKGGSAAKSAAKGGQAGTLNELLYFVNDRIEGYQRAADESQDAQLSGYYKQLVSQSQQFSNELNGYLRQQGGERQTSTTAKGKLYRVWMDAKAAVTGHDEKAILGSNVYGEEWALKAYQEALDDHTLTGTLRQAVERQYGQSQKTYKELQKLESQQA
ncbi:PA2169 family four-helix-bundle protein [Hymenobacter algoricola]|uniref:DUF2383 domain-containing protein n=1 Tax=Hymenobacter algoricola TaxID=486267 RepID=A0ABP7N7L1_9BACT